MASKECISRLRREYERLIKDPAPNVLAMPNEDNILEWHYVLVGVEGTPYESGFYYGKIKFPRQYPLKPPAIIMLTPSGRFKTNTRLCLSYSDFHPETWNPMWSIYTILTGLLSFMNSEEQSYGTISSTDEEKRLYAKHSITFNRESLPLKNYFFILHEQIIMSKPNSHARRERISTRSISSRENITSNTTSRLNIEKGSDLDVDKAMNSQETVSSSTSENPLILNNDSNHDDHSTTSSNANQTLDVANTAHRNYLSTLLIFLFVILILFVSVYLNSYLNSIEI